MQIDCAAEDIGLCQNRRERIVKPLQRRIIAREAILAVDVLPLLGDGNGGEINSRCAAVLIQVTKQRTVLHLFIRNVRAGRLTCNFYTAIVPINPSPMGAIPEFFHIV